MKLRERELADLHELALFEYQHSRFAKRLFNLLYSLHLRFLVAAIRGRNFYLRKVKRCAL